MCNPKIFWAEAHCSDRPGRAPRRPEQPRAPGAPWKCARGAWLRGGESSGTTCKLVIKDTELELQHWGHVGAAWCPLSRTASTGKAAGSACIPRGEAWGIQCAQWGPRPPAGLADVRCPGRGARGRCQGHTAQEKDRLWAGEGPSDLCRLAGTPWGLAGHSRRAAPTPQGARPSGAVETAVRQRIANRKLRWSDHRGSLSSLS